MPELRTSWRGLVMTLGGVIVGGFGALTGEWNVVREYVFVMVGGGTADQTLSYLKDRAKAPPA